MLALFGHEAALKEAGQWQRALTLLEVIWNIMRMGNLPMTPGKFRQARHGVTGQDKTELSNWRIWPIMHDAP